MDSRDQGKCVWKAFLIILHHSSLFNRAFNINAQGPLLLIEPFGLIQHIHIFYFDGYQTCTNVVRQRRLQQASPLWTSTFSGRPHGMLLYETLSGCETNFLWWTHSSLMRYAIERGTSGVKSSKSIWAWYLLEMEFHVAWSWIRVI
jgi:hypothetical protein